MTRFVIHSYRGPRYAVELQAHTMPVSQKERHQINTLVVRLGRAAGTHVVARSPPQPLRTPLEFPVRHRGRISGGRPRGGIGSVAIERRTHASLIALDAMLLPSGALIDAGNASRSRLLFLQPLEEMLAKLRDFRCNHELTVALVGVTRKILLMILGNVKR
jgi:hypothetical protein